MKIALVIPGGVDRSGTERVIPALLALITRLASRHDLHVYALQQEDAAGNWQLCGARIHNIGRPATRRRAVRVICAEHRVAPFQVVHSIWSGSCGLIAVVAAQLLRVPSLVHLTGGELCAMHTIAYGGRLTWRGRLREAVVLRAAGIVSATSTPMIAALSRIGISAQRVPLGVDLQAWPPRPQVTRAPGVTARLLHVGSINRVKDQATLLRAFALLAQSCSDVQLDIVGVDTLHGELESLAQSLAVAHRIRFHGFLTHAALRPMMEAAHVLVMSSLHEAGPMVVLEAATLGVPTVGTAVGHIAEWAPHAALAAPVGDAAGLAMLIDSLLTDEALRQRLGAEAQRRALFEDADHTAACFEQLYAALGCR